MSARSHKRSDPKDKPATQLMPQYQVGSKIKFATEGQRYTVRARTDRYLVCTKPFNAQRTYLYTIVDLMDGIRGPDNFLFGFGTGYDDEDNLHMVVDALNHGELYPSYRKSILLDLEEE